MYFILLLLLLYVSKSVNNSYYITQKSGDQLPQHIRSEPVLKHLLKYSCSDKCLVFCINILLNLIPLLLFEFCIEFYF